MINDVLIKTRIGSEEQERNFIKKLVDIKIVIYVGILSEKWDLRLSICAKNPEHFTKILKDIRIFIPNYIVDFEIFTVVKEPKYDVMLGLLD